MDEALMRGETPTQPQIIPRGKIRKGILRGNPEKLRISFDGYAQGKCQRVSDLSGHAGITPTSPST
jgi:hypothetical protein